MGRNADDSKENVVTWSLKAGVIKLEKTSMAIQRLGKHIPAATNTQATIEEFL
jgi:hypothetical protein